MNRFGNILVFCKKLFEYLLKIWLKIPIWITSISLKCIKKLKKNKAFPNLWVDLCSNPWYAPAIAQKLDAPQEILHQTVTMLKFFIKCFKVYLTQPTILDSKKMCRHKLKINGN